MPTTPTMLALLNSLKSNKLSEFDQGIVYGLTMNKIGGAKDVLASICARAGFSPDEVNDEEEGLRIKDAA